MNDKMFKIVSYALLGLSAILGIYFFAATDFELSPSGNVPTNSGLMLNYSYILAAVATFAAIIFSIIGMVTNVKKAKNALIGIVGVILVFVVGYLMAGNEIHQTINGELLADEAASKKSEAGLIAFYILIIGAIGSIVFAEVSKMFK